MRMALVGRAVVGRFEVPLTLLNEGFMDQVGLNQAHQGSVDGGFVGRGRAKSLGDLLGGEGTAGLEHDGQDRDAGHCNAEIFFTQKCDNVLFGRNGH
jgi:hypothetical protein